jgi:hypothetical protein
VIELYRALPKLAQSGGRRSGRACPLYPVISDINLFRYRRSIVHFYSKISNCACDLGVAKQRLDGPKIPRAPVDQGSLCSSQGMRSEKPRVQPNAADPLRQRRAYWRVVILRSAPRRPVKKNSPDLLLVAFR